MISSIEGNIGAGKTSLLNRLAPAEHLAEMTENLELGLYPHIVYEPLHSWTTDHVGGKSLLQLFGEDPQTWTEPFQRWVMTQWDLTMQSIATQRVQQPLANVVMERSFQSGFHMFAPTLRHNFTDMQWQSYAGDIYQTERSHLPVDKRVFVRVPPDVCLSRINSRGRSGEHGLTLQYLTELDLSLETWYRKCSERNPNSVLVVDGTISHLDLEYEQIVSRVKCFLGLI